MKINSKHYGPQVIRDRDVGKITLMNKERAYLEELRENSRSY